MIKTKEALVLLLAGGVGSRLNILVQNRAKPAVPFAGLYRIIDFSLSNVMNSGLKKVGVLTQYKPLSLMSHLGTGEAWDFTGRSRGVKILPPRTGSTVRIAQGRGFATRATGLPGRPELCAVFHPPVASTACARRSPARTSR